MKYTALCGRKIVHHLKFQEVYILTINDAVFVLVVLAFYIQDRWWLKIVLK